MGSVLGVSKSANHEFSKEPADTLILIEGEGVDGDAHSAAKPQPNILKPRINPVR